MPTTSLRGLLPVALAALASPQAGGNKRPMRARHPLVTISAWLLLASAARAEAPASSEPSDESSDAPASPASADSLGGRLSLSLLGGATVPAGLLERGIPLADVASTGVQGGLEVAYGVSRTVMLGLWGHADRFGSPSTCPDCSLTSWGGGPLLRYHLVQGFRFDPWVSAGFGVRQMSAEAGGTYVGLDWMRATVGGDWYALPSFAVGPFLQFLAGATLDRPDTPPIDDRPAEDQGALYFTGSVGLRVNLLLPGR